MWFPVWHTLKKATNYLQPLSLAYELMQERPGLTLDCKAGQAEIISRDLAQILTSRELVETQVLFIRGAIQPQLQDFSDIVSLQRFVKFSQSDWLVDMLQQERFVSHFQPIVALHDTSQIFGYESLLRGVDPQGALVSPATIVELAAASGLLPQLDRVARLSAIHHFSRHSVAGNIFINFAPTALYDPVACLRSTVEAIDQAGIAHDQVIFEVVESDNPQDLAHLKAVLKYYREAGFRIALDDLGSGYSGLNLLHQLRPDFIKLDMELIRNVHQDSYKASITEKILEIAQSLNIPTVAEGIESVEELAWLRQRNATYAQGFLIAKPNPVPAATTPNIETPPPVDLTAELGSPSSLEHQRAVERIVARVNQRIRQSLDLNEILQTTVDEVRQLFGVDRVVIYRFDPDWSGLVAVESLAEGCPSILGFHVKDTCFQSTHAAYYQQGNTRAVENIDIAGLTPCHVELLHTLNIQANLTVPILQKERLWGLLIAHQCYAQRTWQPSEINLMCQLANQAAIAIQQSELYLQLQQANQELQRLASSDGLTQVANRRCFDDTLRGEWLRLAQDCAPLSMILCDVDCFKLYNDTCGHLAGDDVLRHVAQTICPLVQSPGSLVARYGGEEFAIILPNVDAAGAMALAHAIQAGVRATQMVHPSSQVNPYVTLSLGVATLIPNPLCSPEMLIAAADQGLYEAKAKGKNCAVQIPLDLAA